MDRSWLMMHPVVRYADPWSFSNSLVLWVVIAMVVLGAMIWWRLTR